MKKIPVLFAVLCALLLSWQPLGAATTVNFGTISEITGPADLDLAGDIRYAVRFNGPDMTVNGVTFVSDNPPPAGFSSVGTQNVVNWQTKPEFGSTPDDEALEEIYSDIRWTNAAVDPPLQATMDVTVGLQYRLQILFYGNHAGDRRGWDIQVDNVDAVDNITSLGVDAGGGVPLYSPNIGLVYTYDFTASNSQVNVSMGQLFGVGPEQPDQNAIWSGIILERISAPADTDGDGLQDGWEIQYFGDLSQPAAGDPDADGLNNLAEFNNNAFPNDSDSDNDGLNDGAEVNTHLTNPRAADSDGDGLSDGTEVNTLSTNPRDVDSDNDDYKDNDEVTWATNPSNPDSFPLYSSLGVRFTGGDQDEGLDFDGTFLAAARFGVSTLSGSWPVRDAGFVPYTSVPGLTEDALNEIDQWVSATFPAPATADDVNLTEVVRSIRYNGPQVNITVPGLTIGRSYKLQLLFAEACCANRGFDIVVENNIVGDDFGVALVQGGIGGTPPAGAAFVYGFIATDTTLDILLDKFGVTNPALTDPNAIINALTIEENPYGPDTDGDTLPDTWEMLHFSNLGQTASGDPDSDGRTNLQELTGTTLPNDADTDNDGLNDGSEVNDYFTNPRRPDSDGDGLADGAEVNTHLSDPTDSDSDDDSLIDGAEVNTHGSNPTRLDSDGDGFNDPTEVMNNSNAGSAASVPGTAYIARVFGGDPGEGLDLQGTFPYAFNVGTPGAPFPNQAYDAVFTSDTDAGIFVSAPNEIGAWDTPQFGNTPADEVLNFVYQSIRWADAANADPNMRNVKVDLANITPGRQYKLQLLFGEQCCTGRFFDISVEGTLVIDEFNTAPAQGGIPVVRMGSAIVYTFTATDDTVNILLDGLTATGGSDHNAILNGVTLEELTATVPFEITSVSRTATSITINARGTPGKSYSVDYSTQLSTWEEAWDSLVPNAAGNATWTDTDAVRVNRARGFYKVRDPVLDPTP
jgi:Bacterial TSP3 repeat